MRRQEEPHHTREQVKGYLDDAAAIVAELELDDYLRELAYGKAVDLLAAKQIFFAQPTAIPVDLAGLQPR